MMRTGTVLRYLKQLTILHSHPIGMGAYGVSPRFVDFTSRLT